MAYSTGESDAIDTAAVQIDSQNGSLRGVATTIGNIAVVPSYNTPAGIALDGALKTLQGELNTVSVRLDGVVAALRANAGNYRATTQAGVDAMNPVLAALRNVRAN